MQRHGLALTVVLAVASTSVFAESDGKQLFQEISSEIAKYEAEHHLSNLMARIRETVEAAEIRSIEHHEYTITKYPDVFYDITGLEKGQHPYHATGDWDCDGEEDQAVIVQQPEAQVVVVLSSGATLTVVILGDRFSDASGKVSVMTSSLRGLLSMRSMAGPDSTPCVIAA
jgi:hypothetical protein